MKKVLLGTTAIVAAGMIAAPAVSASEKIKLNLGGYMEQWVGISSQDAPTGEDLSGAQTVSDSEIFFVGKTELDNGITVGVNVQLEGNTSGDQIDESYMFISGGFGKINLGGENSAMYSMNYGPSNYGIGSSSGDSSAWVKIPTAGVKTTAVTLEGVNSVPIADDAAKHESRATDADATPPVTQNLVDDVAVYGATRVETPTTNKINTGGMFRTPFGSTNVEPGGQNDVKRITYYTPRMEGVQFGVSYAPDGQEDANGNIDRDAKDAMSDAVSAAINYKGGMGDVAVGVSLGYGQVTNVPDGKEEPTAMSAGLTLGVNALSFGVAYADTENADGVSSTGYHVGVAYDMGPFGVSLNYFAGEKDGKEDFVTRGYVDPSREKKGSITAAEIMELEDLADEAALEEFMGTATEKDLEGLLGHAEHETIQLSAKYALGAGVSLNGTLGHTVFSSDDAILAGTDHKEVEGTYAVVGFKLSF